MTDYFAHTSLSAPSKALYNGRLQRLKGIIPSKSFAEMFATPRQTVIQIRRFLQDHEVYTAPSFESYIKSLMAYRKYHPEEFPNTEQVHSVWNVLLKEVNRRGNEYREQGQMAPTQREKEGNKLTMGDLKKVMDSLDDGDERKLLLAMYVMIPPMRADYGEVEILPFGHVPTTRNFIYLSSERAVMQIGDHKIASTLGPIREVLPDSLQRVLYTSIRTNPRAYLFGPYSGTRFSMWANKQLTKLLEVPFTLTMFRHIYISNLPIHEMTVEEKKQIAYLMGQTFNPNQQDLYRWI